MCVVTALALIYIHMQMQIIDLAYRGKAKENQIRRLVEQNGNITYKILTLKSSNNLGIKMLAENSDMQFADPESVVHITTPRQLHKNEYTSSKQVTIEDKNESSLFSFISSLGGRSGR